jgi:hypothetical protein
MAGVPMGQLLAGETRTDNSKSENTGVLRSAQNDNVKQILC